MFFKNKSFQTLNLIQIDAKALLWNLDYIQSLHPNSHIFPTIKWNAYGHGIQEIASILKTKQIEYICVDSYFEAVKVREVTPQKILIMGYTVPSNYALMKLKNFTFFVYDVETVHALGKLNKNIRIHLKIDTGMSRQWIQLEEMENVLHEIKRYPKLELEGIATHLADADSIENNFSKFQMGKFSQALEIVKKNGLTPRFIHISNTAGSLKFDTWEWNAIRLGIGLYWVNPLEKDDIYFEKGKTLTPVLSLSTTLIMKKNITKWEKVSYNGTYIAPQDMTIWIVPIGYYEALSRKLSSNYLMYYQNLELPLIGRVCMNLSMLDITGIDIKVWDRIEVISADIFKKNSIYEMAKRSETIPYECLTRLSETIRREII